MPNEIATHIGYWSKQRIPGTECKACIIEQQTIDEDCNDCKYFKRGQLHKSPGLNWFDGHCQKFDKPMHAYPGQYSGHKCFEHRRELPEHNCHLW